jgi:cytochrome c5
MTRLFLVGILAGDSGRVESSSDDASTAADACAEAGVLNGDNFGAAFTLHNCQRCHGTNLTERQGAPQGVSFESSSKVWSRRDDVLAPAGVDPPTMPPMGGTMEDDRQRLRLWLE